MSKEMCKRDKKKRKVKDPEYRCKKCDLEADNKKHLCKPEKL
jgi:hypothetical protein